MDSGSNSTTTVQQADPWPGQQPFLTGGESGGQQVPGVMPEAANLYENSPLQYYPGQTYAPFSPETLLAQQAQTNRAMGGSPLTASMQGQLQANLDGDYLQPDQNPFLSGMMDSIAAKTLPMIDARWGASGRSDSGLASRAAAEGLGTALANKGGEIYENERRRQMQSMLFAPDAANQDYYDIAKLGEVGAQREHLAQQAINEARERFNFENMEPWQRLNEYNRLIQGGYGGTTTSTTQLPRQSLGQGLLGGAIGGGALGYGIDGASGGLIGALGGGLLGGLLR